MEDLKFRRQFLFSPKKCPLLEDWQQENLDTHILYVHKDCEVSRADRKSCSFIIIGYAINPRTPEKTTSDILNDIVNLCPISETSKFPSVNDISDILYILAGRFVLLIKNPDNLMFFHDACGLKTLYYTKYKNEIYAASQPLLMGLVMPLKKSVNYQQYNGSEYVEKTLEHFIPAGSSLYDKVYHLIPNHFFDSKTYKQVRYWPNRPPERKELNEAVQEFTSLLRNIMIAASHRFRLALALTAGLDSRTILSSCKGFARDIFFYTLQFRDLKEDSDDIKIPGKLLSHLGLQHKVIDCRNPGNKNFKEIYVNNTDIHHWNDWGIMASAMNDHYPAGYMNIKGNGPEIGRCVFYADKEHPDITSYEYFISVEREWEFWENIPFIKKGIAEWFDEIADSKVNFGYKLLDLFLWEHRMGSWQAQSQLEWDIVQDSFTPYNNREILDIILSVEPKYRCFGPDYIFFRNSIQTLWKETLKEPINPQKSKVYERSKMKVMLKRALKVTGILSTVKNILRKLGYQPKRIS